MKAQLSFEEIVAACEVNEWENDALFYHTDETGLYEASEAAASRNNLYEQECVAIMIVKDGVVIFKRQRTYAEYMASKSA